MKPLTVAAVQMVSGTDVPGNIATMQTLVRQAADTGAQWVLLPEYWPLMGVEETDKNPATALEKLQNFHAGFHNHQ